MLISFSGLDGAGKSTLIQSAVGYFKSKGRQVTVLTVYDDIAFYSFFRKLRDNAKNLLGMKIKSASLPPEHSVIPQNTKKFSDPKTSVDDKSGSCTRLFYRLIRSQSVRKTCLFLDLMILLFYRLKEEIIKGNVLITDRYFYDSLADVVDLERKKWGFVKFFMKIMPEPDAPIFVDVPAEKAFERKQEYPLEYMKWRHATYLAIFEWVKRPVIIVNDHFDASLNVLTSSLEARMNAR